VPPVLLRRPAAVLALTLACSAPLLATPASAATPHSDRARPVAASGASALSSRVTAALRPLRRAAVSGYAVVEGVGVVVDRGGTRTQAPASTQKLFTAGTALLTLGPAYRFLTAVRRTGAEAPEPQADPAAPAPLADAGGVLHGDLVLAAAGDPTLTRADLAGLAASVAAAGVRDVTGALWLDDTLFDRQRGATGWKPGWVGTEAGPLSALMVDHNLWQRGAAFRADPSPGNLGLFRSQLAAAGVSVQGPSRVGRPADPVSGQVAVSRSAPLDSIVRAMDKASDNTYAEMLLKAVGAAAGGSGTTAAGAQVVRATAAGLGIGLGSIADGSGLSRLDRVDAATQVAWLRALAATPAGPPLRASLPVSCADGTLHARLCGAWASGRVQAKTGTLDRTTALAGYTTTRSGQSVAFSFLVAGADVTAARRAIDAAVTALAASTP